MKSARIFKILAVITLFSSSVFSQNLIYNFSHGKIFKIISKEKITKVFEEALIKRGTGNFWAIVKDLKKNKSIEIVDAKADSNGWYYTKDLEGAFILFEYDSPEGKIVSLNTMGDSYSFINGEMRSGNKYQYKDEYQSWEAKFNYHYLPVKVKEGKNFFLFYCSRGYFKAEMKEKPNDYAFNHLDITLPDLRKNEYGIYLGAIVINNYTDEFTEGLSISAELNGKKIISKVPKLLPLSTRKVKFEFEFAETKAEKVNLTLKLMKDDELIEELPGIEFKIKEEKETYKRTFISEIDGSVQYYAVNPASLKGKNALFLSLHGADVEAINQAGAYYNKAWADIVAPTNRRPYGFDWEYWGRMDALEVLRHAIKELSPDMERIYLIGHSMGGHGTWNFGATYPDKFAAIAPSAGWISLWSYPRSRILENSSQQKEIFYRSVSPSLTLGLRHNYKEQGIYIIHGLADKVVKPNQAEEIIDSLKKFHKDFDFHFEPDAGHWWDKNNENGADCVDWQPMFDFMARHAKPGAKRIRNIDFTTASPLISNKNNWIEVFRQIEPYKFSNMKIRFYDGKKVFEATTGNVDCFGIDLSDLPVDDKFTVKVDNDSLNIVRNKRDKVWFELVNGKWKEISEPDSSGRSPLRNGTFKEAFNHNVVFVYGTNGDDEANRWSLLKAKYDAEYLWYQGNASIDIVSDEEFLEGNYNGRNVIIYGNKDVNSAWEKLMENSPVIVEDNRIKVGEKSYKGKNHAAFFINPVEGSKKNFVGVIAATGKKGRNLTLLRNYFSPVISYPDYLIITPEFIDNIDKGIKACGFLDKNWKLIKDHSFFN